MAWKYFAFDVNEQAFGPGGYTVEFTARWVGRGESEKSIEKAMAKEFNWESDEDERQPCCAGFEEITEEQFMVAAQIGVPGHVVETR